MRKTLLILTTSILSISLCGCGAEKKVSDTTTITSQESQASESEQASDNEDSSEETTVIQLDTSNPNYDQWVQGIYSSVASVPDKGTVQLYKNNYWAEECNYTIENITSDDFLYLIDKYEKDGFNQNEKKDEDSFSAYSGENYISLNLHDDYIMLTLSGEEKINAGWEDGICNKYLTKPDYGECHLMQNQFLDNKYSMYSFDNVTKEQTEKYIETCKENGYQDSPDQTDEDGCDIYWTANSTDGNSWISIKHNIDENSMEVSINSLEN